MKAQLARVFIRKPQGPVLLMVSISMKETSRDRIAALMGPKMKPAMTMSASLGS